MTEDEARGWIRDRFGVQAVDRLSTFLAMVVTENAAQNLISPDSIPLIWSRHAADSAQLLPLAPGGWQTWLDVGTGGGFPGMIVALLAPDRSVTMVEPRRKRAAFLQRCVGDLDLGLARVSASKIQAVAVSADVISARAVASIENLLRSAGHCAKTGTTWLLPRGRSAIEELAALSQTALPMFHVEHSRTDDASLIAIGIETRW